MTKDKWIWMPHAAHFICGSKCQFHLATYVGTYIVSTVGEMWPERSVREIYAEIKNKTWHEEHKLLKGDTYDAAYMKEFGFEDIGFDRKFETMVFKAERVKDQTKKDCCEYRMATAENVDFQGYNLSGEAERGHLKMCLKWSKK